MIRDARVQQFDARRVKDAVDWLSPAAPADIQRVFGGRRSSDRRRDARRQGGTILGAGAMATGLCERSYVAVFEARLMISGAGKIFDASGEIADDKTRDRVRSFAEEVRHCFAAVIEPTASTRTISEVSRQGSPT
jgi:hypothetical protein